MSAEGEYLRGDGITLQTITKPTVTKYRRTKIVCTIGPSCWDKEGLGTLMDAGMNVARFNFSHGDHKSHGAVLERLREVSKEKSRNIAVLLDTKGPEIRTGFFANGVDKITLKKGETIVMTSDYHYKGDASKIACSYPQLATSVKAGQQILCADGSLVLTVLTTEPNQREIVCRIENNCTIGERKNMNLPGVVVDLPTFTEKDVDDIVKFGIKQGVEFIAASFVRKGSDVTNLKKLLADHNAPHHIKIISKIENQEGLENYDDILRETDGIMVARGDLGMEIPPSKVFLAQKFMIRKANIAGKPVITATQMLESMINNPRPTRAECSDVANAVYDGTDAVMLSGETANGPHFKAAVSVMARTCCEAETSRNYNVLLQSIRNSVIAQNGSLSNGESLASSAVKTAMDVKAKLIVVMSKSGKMASYVSKFRPGISSLMLTADKVAARQGSGVSYGMHSILIKSMDTNWEELVDELNHELLASKMMNAGDLLVIVSGRDFSNGMNEQIIINALKPIEETKTHGHFVKGGGLFFNRGLLLSFSSD